MVERRRKARARRTEAASSATSGSSTGPGGCIVQRYLWITSARFTHPPNGRTPAGYGYGPGPGGVGGVGVGGK